VHASRSPSPHGFNRICSNSLISSNATRRRRGQRSLRRSRNSGASEPDASAPDDAGSLTAPVGYAAAAYLKTASDSAAGANWYFYERVPLDNTVPHDANGVVADGLGSNGSALTICVNCHSAAGSDDAHLPSPNGHDEVYASVP
jgi:cytochrome c553